MKKLFLSILSFFWMLSFSSSLFAQKTFDEATFMAMMNRLQTDPAFFKNEADPSFTILFGNGTQSNQEGMLKFAQANVGLYKRKETNLKVIQVGSTAIATGLVEESFYTKENPQLVSRSDKEYYTYTFTLNKGKWLWVAAQHTDFQEPFTKETLNEMMAEYKTDSKVFFNNRLASDFRYTNSKGDFQPQKDFLGGTSQSIVKTEMLEPVIFHSGDLAITSGIHQTVRTNKDGKQTTSQEAATYTWSKRNGKWMFVASQHGTKPFETDEKEIKDVLQKETYAITKSRNAVDFMNCYANKKDLMFGPYKNTMLQGYDTIKAEAEEVVKNNPTASPDSHNFSNWNVKINGNSAFVTYQQTTTKPDGAMSQLFKSDYLEKSGGEWKIVDHRFIPMP